MADTLTYQESEPNTEQVSLNEAEQEALAVGEQMERDAGNAKLAGKFDSPEQLEKAYMELQSKFSSRDPSSDNTPDSSSEEDAGEAEEQPEEEESQDTTDISFLDELWEGANAEGEPSKELVDKLQKMDSSKLADMYVQYRQQVESKPRPTSDFTGEQVDALYGLVGGEEQYGQLIGWAANTLSKDEIQMFDAVMDSGDANAAFWAIRGLAMQYADTNGYEGKRVSGKAPKSSDDNQFRSQAELVQAMSDPRYDSDDAYRRDVMSKLENSSLNF